MIPDEVSSISDQFKGLKAIHYVGELGKKLHNRNVYEGEGNQENADGVFRLHIIFFYYLLHHIGARALKSGSRS